MTNLDSGDPIELTPEQATELIHACVIRLRSAASDRGALDKIILLHQPSAPDSWSGDVDCMGCYSQWPCETQQVIQNWGAA